MEDLEKITSYFVEEIKVHGGDTVRSIVLHGSALGPEFRPGSSDYNFVVLAEPVDIPLLQRLAARTGKWRRKKISPPLLISPEMVRRSLDSYPLEFLSMQARYRVLQGDDFLRGLTFEKEYVRLQCEREVKSKLLLMRRLFLESEGSPKRLQHLVARGLPSLVAIFRGMLYLKDGPWQVHGDELYDQCAALLGLPPQLLHNLHQVRHQRSAPGREHIHRQMEEVLLLLHDLAVRVDAW
jgi:hypothetical protein